MFNIPGRILAIACGVVAVLAAVALFLIIHEHKAAVQAKATVTFDNAANGAGREAAATVSSNSETSAAIDQQVNNGKAAISAASNAHDSAGDAGFNGLRTLCGMRGYATDPRCAMFRHDPAQVEGRNAKHASPGG